MFEKCSDKLVCAIENYFSNRIICLLPYLRMRWDPSIRCLITSGYVSDRLSPKAAESVSLSPINCDPALDFPSIYTDTVRMQRDNPSAEDTRTFTPNYSSVWNAPNALHHFHTLCDLHYHLTENTKAVTQQNLTALRHSANPFIFQLSTLASSRCKHVGHHPLSSVLILTL
jgi:hypothetical protein